MKEFPVYPSGEGLTMRVVRLDFTSPAPAPHNERSSSEQGDQPRERVPWEGSTRRERLPPDWNERVKATFRDHGDICHVCGESGAEEVDHIIHGDNHDLDNLRPIHSWRTPQRCHVYKTAKEAAQARWRPHRPPEKHPGLL